MIRGSHVVVLTKDAAANRALFRDVLQVPAVDAGGGWLAFARPPAEVACYPAGRNDDDVLYLICDDRRVMMEALVAEGVGFDQPSEKSWGTQARVHLPGGDRIGLYEPKPPVASR